jgi:hypothetical protein
MKTTIHILLGTLSVLPMVHGKDIDTERLWSKDTNKGAKLWQRMPGTSSRDMIAALKKAGVKPGPKYTEFPGFGHGSWNDAYADAAMWDWMFAQRRQPNR